MIAGMIQQETKAAALVTIMRWDSAGKQLLSQAAAIEDPAELIQPFRDDPASWAILSKVPADKLQAFAAEFIAEAKR